MNATTIEKNYKEFLNCLSRSKMSAESIKNDHATYNEVAEKTFQYLRNVALRSSRNRNLINCTGYDFNLFADDITMHILRKLDAVLSCSDEYVIPFLIKMVNNKVVSICRKWERTYPTLKKRNTKGSATSNETYEPEAEPEFNAVFNFLDDVSWSLIADDTNIEADIIHQEETLERHSSVLKALACANSCSRFEIMSLLATKVITNSDNKCMKTRALADAVDKIGLSAVSEACFETAALLFDISSDNYFSSFTNDYTPEYTTIEDLCDKISHASNNCAVKLCKKMGATRVAKKCSR